MVLFVVRRFPIGDGVGQSAVLGAVVERHQMQNLIAKLEVSKTTAEARCEHF